MPNGAFIISLDFELHWGVRDVVSLARTKDHFLRARESIPEVLQRFVGSEVHATWATVGFLFARDKRHLLDHLPEVRPAYTRSQFDPYPHLDQVGDDERRDPFHYAPSLIRAISGSPGQEIASHTFSHYYCLEEGQSEAAFEADLEAAAAIGAPLGPVTSSLVFPRGQHNPAYDAALRRKGVRAYRTPPAFRPYQSRRTADETLGHRGLRLLDTYLPLGGTYATRASRGPEGLVHLSAGLFLRPYSPSRRRLEPIRLQRLTTAMRHAAQNGLDFHLWWHPHNFGTNTAENLLVLDAVLSEYRTLRERYAWPSRTMAEAAQSVAEST